MTLAKDIANAVIEHLSSRSGFDHWWEEVQPSIKELVVQDLAGVIARVAAKDNPPDSTRYTYEHTWYDANSKTTLKVCECDTLEEAVSHVMERAILQNLTPPYWWVKP